MCVIEAGNTVEKTKWRFSTNDLWMGKQDDVKNLCCCVGENNFSIPFEEIFQISEFVLQNIGNFAVNKVNN